MLLIPFLWVAQFKQVILNFSKALLLLLNKSTDAFGEGWRKYINF